MAPGRSKDGKPSEVLNTEAHWEIAQQYAELFGRPHTLFTAAIRYLRGLSDKGTTILTETEPYPLSMLLKSPSMRSVLYYAAAALRKDDLTKVKDLDGFTLFRLFPPEELASILSVTYIYRRVKKICDQRIWETLSQEIQIQMETGFHVGSKIPAIASHRGLLVGAVRYAAMGLFSIKDQRNFRLLKRTLNEKEKLFALDYEIDKWKCDHLQIASVLLQSMGLGVAAAKSLMFVAPPEANEKDVEKILPWFAARAWIQSLLEEERAPSCFSAESGFTLGEEELALLQERVESIYEMGSSFDWIDKTKEDLPKNLFDKIGSGLPEPPQELQEQAGIKEDSPDII